MVSFAIKKKVHSHVRVKVKERMISTIHKIKNTKTKDIVEEISRVTGCEIEIANESKEYSFPVITIERAKNEFKFKPRSIIDDLENIIESYKKTNSKI